MFVAITKITENGQPVYCVNPVETTLDFSEAFKFYDKREIEMALKESKEIYDLNAMPIEIVKSKVSSLTKRELQVI